MLSVVATPIGNLKDMSLRSIEILRTCDLIACEDTRVTGVLLKHIESTVPLMSYHSHSTELKLEKILSALREGKHVALVSDAGTPCISDPGYHLVKAAREESMEVEAIPGPAAFLTALMASGLPLSAFRYMGFLPVKKGRQTLLNEMAELDETLVFYESKYRLLKTLAELKERTPDRMMVLAKEITKLHETFLRGTVTEVEEQVKNDTNLQKGELVLILPPLKLR